MTDRDTLSIALKKITDTVWADGEEPVLLSNLPSYISSELPSVNYRALLDGKSIKQFVQETGDLYGYKLIEHPLQKAKVGIVPRDADFRFEETPPSGAKRPASKNKAEATIMEFFKLLATLSEKDLDKVVLPTSVIAKLLK